MKYTPLNILVILLVSIFVMACSSAGTAFNDPDDQRSRRDSAIGELDKNTKKKY